MSEPNQPRQLSVPTMCAFGIGQAAGSFKNIAWGTLLLFYYQQVVARVSRPIGCASLWSKGVRLSRLVAG